MAMSCVWCAKEKKKACLTMYIVFFSCNVLIFYMFARPTDIVSHDDGTAWTLFLRYNYNSGVVIKTAKDSNLIGNRYHYTPR